MGLPQEATKHSGRPEVAALCAGVQGASEKVLIKTSRAGLTMYDA